MNKKIEPLRIEIPYVPNAKQAIFHASEATEVVYGGAKGGGKSLALIIDAIIYALKYANANIYLFRETYDDLEANLISEFKTFCPKEALSKSYNESKHEATFFNGSVIRFRFVSNYTDAQKYHGRSIDYVGVDELTKHEERSIQELVSCMRSAKGHPVKFRGTCNPGGIGHAWVKKRYISATEYGEKDTVDIISGNTIKFIPATVYDNTTLMKNDPAYIRRLENLSHDKKRAFLYGDWDVYEGMAFEKWNPLIHVIEPFKVPDHWRKWMAADNGYTDPFAWYWFAVDELGTVYITREFTRDYDDQKLTYTQQAERIAEINNYEEYDEEMGRTFDKTIRLDEIVLGHDAFAKSHETGKTLVDYYIEGGVKGPFTKAVTDRKLRKATWIEYLEPRESGEGIITSKIKIFSNCKKLVETLPLQVNDENDTEKVALTDYDHWYDGAGYGLIAFHLDKSKHLPRNEGIIEQHKRKLAKKSVHSNKRLS